MYRDEGPPVWSGASLILAGNDTQRFVAYPIGTPDPQSGLSTISWISEKSVDPSTQVAKEDWNREVTKVRFAAGFEGWVFDWLNVADMIDQAGTVYEYPMIDREPLGDWNDGRATLISDAAHATYPVGSSGASQAIMDTRILGVKFLEFGTAPEALNAYEEALHPMANKVTLANQSRGGPDAIMQMAEDSREGAKLDQTLPYKARSDHAERFKRLAGLDIESINNRAPTIPVS